MQLLDHAYLARRVASTALVLSLISAGIAAWKDYASLKEAVVKARIEQAQQADERSTRIAKAQEAAAKAKKNRHRHDF